MDNCDTVISSSHIFLSRSQQHKTLNNNFSNCHGEQIKLSLKNFRKYNPSSWYKQQ